MRPWMIVLSSLSCGIVAAAALAWPEVSTAPRAEIVPVLLTHLPARTIAFLAVYALVALLLTTGALVGAVLPLRRRLAQMIAHRGPARLDWPVAFEASGLRSLAPKAPGLDRTLLSERLLDPSRTRGEIARLDYLGLARSHFFSALVGLAAIVALGLAQDHARFSLLSQPIPTVSAVLILVGLILLAVLARLAIDVAADPLVETMSQIPVERAETGLLHRAAELLEGVRFAATARGEATPPPALQLPDRLVEVFEDGHRALIEAIGQMSAAADALGATTRSSVEALEARLHAAEARPQPPAEAGRADAEGFAELRDAVQSLTALLERLSAPRQTASEATLDTVPATRPAATEPQFARELRKLLQEIDAEP